MSSTTSRRKPLHPFGTGKSIYLRPKDLDMWSRVMRKAERLGLPFSEAMTEAAKKWVEDEPASA